jgi:RimJ/RimL family protein N-acetyltransferase
MTGRMPEQFATARLVAERLTAAHRDDLRAMLVDPGHMQHLGGVLQDEGDVDRYLERAEAHWVERHCGIWMLRESADGPIIGRGVLRWMPLDDGEVLEVGYGFNPPWWGKGYATEIATALMAQAEAAFGPQPIYAITRPANAASRRVLEKLGMTLRREVEMYGAAQCLYVRIR